MTRDLQRTPEGPLRVGFVVPHGSLPAWQAAILEGLSGGRLADLAAFIVVPAAPASAGLMPRIAQRLDAGLPGKVPDALAPVASASVAAGAPVVPFDPGDGGHACAERLRRLGLDVLVALTDPQPLGPLAAIARYGLWTFDYGGEPFTPADGRRIALADVFRRRPTFTSALRVRLGAGECDRLAGHTRSAVHARSHRRTLNEHLWKCSGFVPRALRLCRDWGLREFPPWSEPAPAAPPSGFGALASYAAWRLSGKLRRRAGRERWVLLAGRSGQEDDLRQLDCLEPPPGRFWADPHAVAEEGRTHLYFEDASCADGKGHIALMTRQADGSYSRPVPVLERPYHLSYPFVFRWQGIHYMIPETADNGAVELYRCTRFPDRWEHLHNLIDGIRAYDATLVEHEGRWWMFANVVGTPGASSWDELSLFSAESPLSRDWRPHRANPVVSDVCRSRPAGPFIRRDGLLIRPSQDSSGRYGRALNFNRVDELSDRCYRETTIRTVEPPASGDLLAVHSYCGAAGLAFLDAIRRESA